ncbi:MAG: T9SS type A sorting domain-containing protein [Bacteroidota bacterium]
MSRLGLPALLLVMLAGTANAQQDTWDVIQTRIFDNNCVQCHVAGSGFAAQSGLVLTADVSYDNLIDVPPKNSAAAKAGLVRISSVGGLPAPHLSFLWEKVNAPNQAHFYDDHPDYGSLMPLGLPSLTTGEINYLTAWIEAGAPENGIVADEALLNDDTRYEPPPFTPLDPPAQGMQFHVGPFDVWPAEVHDREFLYYEPFETTEDVFVSGYEISMRPGSHHFILYNYPAGVSTPPPQTYRDVRQPNGTLNAAPLLQLNVLFPFRFFVGTQTPYIRYQFPEGVALRLPAGSGFDLNSHSVNRSTETITGEVYANIYTVDEEDVDFFASPGNFNNMGFELPPNQVTTVSKTFTFGEQQHILQMWAHAHERMTEFRIEGVGGKNDNKLLYWTNDWEHPPLLHLDPPLTFEAGDQVRLVTTYNNTTDRTIRFGLLSSDEMQFMFYQYFTGELPTSTEEEGVSPDGFALAQNFPNPFSGSTTITYQVPQPTQVKIRVYDVLGQEVQLLSNQTVPAGKHEVAWDAENQPSGVYFIVMEAGAVIKTKTAFLIK